MQGPNHIHHPYWRCTSLSPAVFRERCWSSRWRGERRRGPWLVNTGNEQIEEKSGPPTAYGSSATGNTARGLDSAPAVMAAGRAGRRQPTVFRIGSVRPRYFVEEDPLGLLGADGDLIQREQPFQKGNLCVWYLRTPHPVESCQYHCWRVGPGLKVQDRRISQRDRFERTVGIAGAIPTDR